MKTDKKPWNKPEIKKISSADTELMLGCCKSGNQCDGEWYDTSNASR